jgi:hypothetical protein
MRIRRRAVALLATGLLLGGVPASQALNAPAAKAPAANLSQLDPGVGGFMSKNLSYIATLANESPGVSARVMQIGAVKRLYVSSAKNLSVYNITNPELPLLMGTLDTHNWENEDVTVSKDGKTVLMSDFEGVAYLITITVTDLPGGLVALTPTGYLAPGGNHIVDCIDDACNVVYGSEGKIYDLKDKAKPVLLSTKWTTAAGTTSGHNVTKDASGLVWTDTTPIVALDPSVDPVHPRVVAKSDRTKMTAAKTAYQHNSIRPFADQYQQRAADDIDLSLKPGEILMGEGETNFTQTSGASSCGPGNGPFATYNLRNFDKKGSNGKTVDFSPIEVFRPINGTYDGDGDAAINALGCSGHWFDVAPTSTPTKILTANGWYEHGTRLFNVDGTNGKISQVGYFQPVVGSASAAYWVDATHVYVVDYARGIDILKYNPNAPVPTQAEFDASWLAKLNAPKVPAAEAARYSCKLAMEQANEAA